MKQHTYKKLIDRLSRAEGQIRALKKALAEDHVRDCKAFLTQIKAARSALLRTSEEYVLYHIHSCESLPPKKREEQITEAIKTLAHD